MKNVCFGFMLLCVAVNTNAQFGEPQLIDNVTFLATIVYASDLDGDNDLDVLVSGWNANIVAWYENLDGEGAFGEIQYIDQNLFFTQSLSTADFDGDGDMDVLASSRGDDKVVWYENLDGLGDFSTAHIINDTAPFVKEVVAVDIDGDNDMDVVAAVTNVNKVVWYENMDGLGNFSDENIISNTTTGVYYVDTADVNGDGFIDVITNSSTIGMPSWFENLDGLGNFGTENIIDFNGTFKILPADIDNDGDIDIFKLELVDGIDVFTWLENTDSLGAFEQRQTISSIFQGSEMDATDIDNDGDIDLFTVYVGDENISWFENLDGLGTFGERQTIDNFASTSIVGADLDGDGYKDALTIANHDPVWYKNLTYLSINDNILSPITISPNPTKGLVTITAPNTIIKSVRVYDMLGKQVLTQKNYTQTINLTTLQSGFYLIKVETVQGTLVKRIVKE